MWREILSSFNARLRLPGHTRLPLGVEVDILNERMTLTAGERTVANWPLEQLDIRCPCRWFSRQASTARRWSSTSPTRRPSPPRWALRPHRSARSPRVPDRRARRSVRPCWRNRTTHELEDLRRRISDFARDLAADAVPPADVFARWLRLLKEINRRLGEGSLPTSLFYQLNTHLLDADARAGPRARLAEAARPCLERGSCPRVANVSVLREARNDYQQTSHAHQLGRLRGRDRWPRDHRGAPIRQGPRPIPDRSIAEGRPEEPGRAPGGQGVVAS